MNNERLIVKHKSESGIVNFIYDYQNEVSFFRFNSNDEVELKDFNDNENEKTYTIKRYEDIKNINGIAFDNEEKMKDLENYIKEKVTEEDKKRIVELIRSAGIEEIEDEVPELNFYDYTENYLFGYPIISKNFLEDKNQGIWAGFGTRKLKFEVNNLEDIKNKLGNVSLRFYKIDNDSLSKEIETKILNKSYEEDKLIVDMELDSDLFINEFLEKQQYAKFTGSLEVELIEENRNKLTICYPVQIIFHNTNLGKEKNKGIIKTDKVSIDFGTSSTCVAVSNQGKIEFITLSMEDTDTEYNKFENPTNIMIYRWKDIYEEWKNENKKLPLFLRGNKNDDYEGKKISYDSGYTVKELIKDATKREMNSILTQIKLIPYELEKETTLTLTSSKIETNDEKEVVKLVNDYERQNDEMFDPVAFYSYLLGRIINNPSNPKIYTKFSVTYPVKFNNKLRNKLKKSIEYGLKRALPISLQESEDEKGRPIFNVSMEFPEPVAYVGAICGNYLKLEDNPVEYFAIYDFGGGTLDFSFGIFRENEDEESVIEILGVDGNEEIGGERLINRISYWVYQENIEILKENRIPFEKLRQEKISDEMDENLLNNSDIAKLNLKKINEAISRPFFEGKDDEINEAVTLSLFNVDGEMVEITIASSKEIIYDKLKEILDSNVEHFYNALEGAFKNNLDYIKNIDSSINSFEDLLNKINIFKSGNAVKNGIIKEIIENRFSNNKIYLVDETDIDFEKREEKKYAITPKTAVAYGQINITNFELDIERIKRSAFSWNVYKFLPQKGKLELVISRQDKNNEWKFFSKIKNSKVIVYFASDIREKRDGCAFVELEFDEEDNGKYLYVKCFGDNEIEYVVEDDKTENITKTNIERKILSNN